MSRLRMLMMFVLVASWLPATSHCALEAIELIGAHCCEADSDTVASDCEDELCCAFEKAAVPLATTAVTVSSPLLASACLLHVALVAAPPPEAIDRLPDPAPAPWLHSWQFVQRTALPVRAPAPA